MQAFGCNHQSWAKRGWLRLAFVLFVSGVMHGFNPEPLQAQTQTIAQVPPAPAPQNPLLPGLLPPTTSPPSPTPVPVLPPPENLLLPPGQTTPAPSAPEAAPSEVPGAIKVDRFEVLGSTVFSAAALAKQLEPFTQKPLSFAELQQASAVVTKLYTDRGYVTSGAFIPADQTFKADEGNVVKIQVMEGGLEDIQVSGTRRLNPNYVRSRLAIATGKPLNVDRLLRALQLLQLDPLISSISAELATGSHPGASLLNVKVAEARTASVQITLDNNRVPSIGSFQRQIQLNEANLLGQGDGLSVSYANTDGSNDVEVNYSFPINARNGTLQFSFNNTSSKVVEEPFALLDIRGKSQDYALTYRQSIVQTPTQELALGVTLNRRISDIGFLEALIGERLPFPSPGAVDGITRLTVLRFFQEWTQRSSQQVLAARSQFSVGFNAFNTTTNADPPDSRFFSWRGQAQWVRLLAPETLFLVRADAQLADRALVPLEQFGLGGQQTVRGYRQDLLLTDQAFFGSVELRVPILRLPKLGGVLQLTPFFDFGTASNQSDRPNPDPNTIASLGLGLLWQSKNITARFDWGIPLVDASSRNNTLQEQGFYFSLTYTKPF